MYVRDSESFLVYRYIYILREFNSLVGTSNLFFADFEIFFSSSISSFYDAVEIPSLKIDVRRTLWLSDPIKRFMSQYFIGDAENSLTGKMRNGISIERNPLCQTGAFYSENRIKCRLGKSIILKGERIRDRVEKCYEYNLS